LFPFCIDRNPGTPSYRICDAATHELGIDTRTALRVAAAFTELAQAI
jgi:hypothetical protein